MVRQESCDVNWIEVLLTEGHMPAQKTAFGYVLSFGWLDRLRSLTDGRAHAGNFFPGLQLVRIRYSKREQIFSEKGDESNLFV